MRNSNLSARPSSALPWAAWWRRRLADLRCRAVATARMVVGAFLAAFATALGRTLASLLARWLGI